MSDLGIGIVGYGKVGAGAHRNWAANTDGAKLVAVCDGTDVRQAAAAEENPGISIYENLGDMLADDSVVLVIVTTPPSSHCELAVQALEAGKHVFVDKPFAMTKAEAEQMLDAAEQAGKVIHCHQSRRYDGEYRAIVKAVSDGKIGEVQHVRRIWSQYGEGWASWGIEGFNPTWRIQRAYGGGMVYDYAPHCGDQILRLVDKPLHSVFADARGIKFSDEVDDHFSCMMRFGGGATAYLECSNMTTLSAPHWYVIGTEGSLSSAGVNKPVELKRGESDEIETLEPIREIDELYTNVIASCRGEATPLVTADQLRASMGLIDAIFQSSQIGEMEMVR